jgi:hypothetical protein
MRYLYKPFLVAGILSFLLSCGTRSNPEKEQVPVVTVKANPVVKGDIESEISFNGKTLYISKTQIVSPIAGYVASVKVKFGQEVQKDEVLFEIQTKERKALESDPNSSQIGSIKVKAVTAGFVSELSIHEQGGFVAEGGVLCTVADSKDLMVQVNIPFENNSIPVQNRKCRIVLPDHTTFDGTVSRILPEIDEINQTQTILVRPETVRQVPENLNLRVSFVNERHKNSMLVSRSALMTNETQSEFWVMKVNAGNIAMKVPVVKGLVNDTVAEIISNGLKFSDLIITEGSYGLPDSTLIRIER